MWIIKNRRIFYIISSTIVALSLATLLVFGVKFGIDFTGGSLVEVRFEDGRPALGEVQDIVDNLDFITDSSLRESGEASMVLRSQSITNIQKDTILETLSESYTITEERFSTIGPSLGSELQTKSVFAVVVALILIVLFVAYAFRLVSKPVSSGKYGLITVVAFLHDLIIPLGVFALLGVTTGLEVDSLFVTALLVILGYSINDTIIVFDRIRENLLAASEESRVKRFEKIVGKSIEETYARSINTSFTTIIALGALYVFGGVSTQAFALALIVGVVAGTYSSIFLASSLLVTVKKYQDKKIGTKKA